jgi:uncharacterized protein DUF3987
MASIPQPHGTGESSASHAILETLDLLHAPGDVFEIRILTPRCTISGYYNDRRKAVANIARWNGQANVYLTANPVNPALLSRAHNRLKDYAKETTNDKDSVARRWLLLDFDAPRPAGISSTNAEHDAALTCATEVYQWLQSMGFPGLILADSGNGGHVMARVDLPNDDASTKLVQRCTHAVALRFSDNVVTVDLTVTNPARIWKCYGTMACKGDNTPERPHRLARILNVQEPHTPAPLALLEQLADMAPKEPKTHAKQTAGGHFDIEQWITEHGLDLRGPFDWSGGRKWIFSTCPWNSEHTNRSAYIVQFASGALAAGCHHNGCYGKRWPDLRATFEPEWRPWQQNGAGVETHGTARGGAPTPEPNQPEEWPEPEPLPAGLLPVPHFDEKLLPQPLRPWLSDIAERIQCPPEFPTIGAFVVLASIVGRRICIRPKRRDDWLVVPNLWGAVIARPGFLKTPALAEVLKPLQRLEHKARLQYDEACKGVEMAKLARQAQKEDNLRRIREALKKGNTLEQAQAGLTKTDEGNDPTLTRYIVNDSTVEKLGELLNQNPNGLLLFRDELTGWLRTLDKDGHENDRAFYLESWNGTGPYRYDRIGRGTLHIGAACMSVLGGIQPGPLADYLRAALRGGSGDDGLLQRFQLAVYPDDPGEWKNVDRWPNTEAKNNAYAVFENLATLDPLTIGAEKVEGEEVPFLRFPPAAQELFDGWRTDLEQKLRSRDEHPAIEAHLAKYRSLMPSLTLIFWLCSLVQDQDSEPAAIQAAKLAAAWCDFLEEHARRIYQGATQHALFSARTLATRILAGKVSSPFTTRMVYQNGWTGLTTAEDAEQAADILEGLAWLRSERLDSGPQGGRPQVKYHISPHISPSKDAK